ncbi:hypothetical protein FB451DRAFT_1433024 [Mycena latifolia]|nr:hypothetical protein FB451DRAFT_1433024 [Mycena latifolia]
MQRGWGSSRAAPHRSPLRAAPYRSALSALSSPRRTATLGGSTFPADAPPSEMHHAQGREDQVHMEDVGMYLDATGWHLTHTLQSSHAISTRASPRQPSTMGRVVPAGDAAGSSGRMSGSSPARARPRPTRARRRAPPELPMNRSSAPASPLQGLARRFPRIPRVGGSTHDEGRDEIGTRAVS